MKSKQTGTRRLLGALLLCAPLILAIFGCARRSGAPFEPRRPLLLERTRQREGRDIEDADKQMSAELVFQTGGRVERLQISNNSRRALVERRLDDNVPWDDYPSLFEQQKALAEENPGSIGIELWNIDFADARLETIYPNQIGITSSTLNSAVFDEKGDRLFWTERDISSKFSLSSIEDNALVSQSLDLNLAASVSKGAPADEEIYTSNNGASNTSSLPNAKNSLEDNPNPPIVLAKSSEESTVIARSIATRVLETRSSRQDGTSVLSPSEEIKHIKIPDEAKRATSIRPSLKSRWLICGMSDSFNLNESGNSEESSDWYLVLLRDRRRVVHFPSTVKMTFDNATSDEEISGRIVDVLDVSDEGDLCATLVEETVTAKQTSETTNFSFSSPAPRYKIVVWDLYVARTVDINKAKKPLMAIEVTQIPISTPIPRKYCKFSPTGERLAARVEPRYITIWQSTNGRRSIELGEHADVIRDFDFAPRGTKLVASTGGTRPQVVLWEIRQGAVHRTLDDSTIGSTSIDSVTFSPDGDFVYFANNLGEVKRWNVQVR